VKPSGAEEARWAVNRPVIVLGAGGHARVVIEVLRRIGAEILGYAAPAQLTTLAEGVGYLGNDEALEFPASEILLANGLGSGDALRPRIELFTGFVETGFSFATLVHPSAVVAEDVTLGQGAQVMAGAVLQPGCQVGDNAIINTRAVLDHDCLIGAHTHIAPGATLCGGVTIAEAVLVGVGACIRPSIDVGTRSVIGAGAAVVSAVGEGKTVVGVPAKEAIR